MPTSKESVRFLNNEVHAPQPIGIGEHDGTPYYWSLVPHPYQNKLTNAVITPDRKIYVDSTYMATVDGMKVMKGEDAISADFGLQYVKPMMDQQALYTWGAGGNSKYSIFEFVCGTTTCTIKEAYDRLIEINKKHVYHTDERTHKLIVLKILETYFHKMFHAIGKMHIQGEMGSGKSTQTRVFAYYAFNPLGSSVASEAAFRRVMSAVSGTLVLDDQDDVSDDFRKFLNRMVKVSYTKGMSKAILTKIQGKGEIEVFDLFFPIVTNGIMEVDNVAASREFIIYMLKTDARFPKLNHNQELHDMLYVMGMCEWQNVKKAYEEMDLPPRFGGRLEEIVRPVLAIAKCISPELETEMEDYVFENYISQMSAYENEDYFFRAISKMLEDFAENGGQVFGEWTPKSLAQRIIDGEGNQIEKERRTCAYIIGRRMKNTPSVFAATYPNGQAKYRADADKLLRFVKVKGWDKYISNLEDIERIITETKLGQQMIGRSHTGL